MSYPNRGVRGRVSSIFFRSSASCTSDKNQPPFAPNNHTERPLPASHNPPPNRPPPPVPPSQMTTQPKVAQTRKPPSPPKNNKDKENSAPPPYVAAAPPPPLGYEADDETSGDEIHAEGDVKTVINDPSLLLCHLCSKTFTREILHCEHGHSLCSICFFNLEDRTCPICLSPHFGRDLQFEKLLHSVTSPCINKKVGCDRVLAFARKRVHENRCPFTQCVCPIADCQFSHSSRNLYKHFSQTHSQEFRKFRFAEPIAIGYDDREKTLFQDEDEGVIFLLHQSLGREERRFELLVIGSPSEFETAFKYSLNISCYRIVVSLDAVPRVCPQWVPHYPIQRFLSLPRSFQIPGRIELTINKTKRPKE